MALPLRNANLLANVVVVVFVFALFDAIKLNINSRYAHAFRCRNLKLYVAVWCCAYLQGVLQSVMPDWLDKRPGTGCFKNCDSCGSGSCPFPAPNFVHK